MKTLLRFSSVLILCISLHVSGVAQSLNSGLVACYPFSGNANDQSGNGHNGTVSGAKLVADRYNNPNSAYQFNGSTDYIDLTGVVTDSGEFAVSFWSKTLKFKSQFTFCMIPDQFGDRIALHTNYNHNGDTALIMDFGNAGGNGRLAKTPMPNMNWGWEHYVYQSSASQDSMWIYRNNVLEIAGKQSSTMQNKNRVLRIGGCQGTVMFNGIIDDVKIYERPLTKTEVGILYNSTSVNCMVTTVNELNTNKVDFNIVPNPNNGNFRVTFNDNLNTAVNIRLIDITGKVVFEATNIKTNNYTVSGDNVESGIYQLVVNTDNSIQTKKVIISK